MDINTVKAFLMWCTVINFALLILSSLISIFAANRVYQIHSKLFSIPREFFNAALYSFLGLYKVFFFVFNLIPYIALLIITKQ